MKLQNNDLWSLYEAITQVLAVSMYIVFAVIGLSAYADHKVKQCEFWDSAVCVSGAACGAIALGGVVFWVAPIMVPILFLGGALGLTLTGIAKMLDM